MGTNLLAAYTEYLERMFQASDDLENVDVFSVPWDVDMDKLSEWASVG